MMRDELIGLLDSTIQSCTVLLTGDGALLTVYQERYVQAVERVAIGLRDLLISLPEVDSASAKELLSYESRSHLASIIGYAEMLLDQTDGELSDDQRQHIERIRTAGKRTLKLLMHVVDAPE